MTGTGWIEDGIARARSAVAGLQNRLDRTPAARAGLVSRGDPTVDGWVARAFEHSLAQPNQLTCGSATLLVSRMVNDEAYAEFMVTGRHPRTRHHVKGTVEERFRAEALALHKRTTGPVDVRGRLQMPWVRALGTPPWAAAREMSGGAGVPRSSYRVHTVSPSKAAADFDRILAASGAGHCLPLYVGNGVSPRHVVLVIATRPDALRIYEPARGRRQDVSRRDFVASTLDVAGWSTPWFAVLPSR